MAKVTPLWRNNLICLAGLFLFVSFVSSFEFSGYCSRMCMWGRGGNLCKCSAVHFAGKRTSTSRRTPVRLMEEGLEDPENGLLGSSEKQDSRDVMDLRLGQLLQQLYKQQEDRIQVNQDQSDLQAAFLDQASKNEEQQQEERQQNDDPDFPYPSYTNRYRLSSFRGIDN